MIRFRTLISLKTQVPFYSVLTVSLRKNRTFIYKRTRIQLTLQMEQAGTSDDGTPACTRTGTGAYALLLRLLIDIAVGDTIILRLQQFELLDDGVHGPRMANDLAPDHRDLQTSGLLTPPERIKRPLESLVQIRWNVEVPKSLLDDLRKIAEAPHRSRNGLLDLRRGPDARRTGGLSLGSSRSASGALRNELRASTIAIGGGVSPKFSRSVLGVVELAPGLQLAAPSAGVRAPRTTSASADEARMAPLLAADARIRRLKIKVSGHLATGITDVP